MNTDKAYILGLIIGGGIFGDAEDVFRIRLPYKKWGSYIENPQRAGEIAGDILRKVGQMFRAIYNISVQYETLPGGTWIILCEGDITPVKNDLQKYGIIAEGEIRGSADISNLVLDLVDDNLKRRFVAGLADTIGSMAKSQRRFSDEHQILSFEIKGYNFRFVCALCRLLYSINCIPDQVNWNHPNIHCPSDPYYKQWNKGFKLRILLDQYAKFGAFAFRTKAETSAENRKLQGQTHEAIICEERDIHVTPSSIHPAEHDSRLPKEIRDGHYLHFRHYCAVLGCEHAPYNKIKSCFSQIGNLVNPFPILCKNDWNEILQIINDDILLSSRKYNKNRINITELIENFQHNDSGLLYGTDENNGYPITEILKAVAYVIADEMELFGKRPKGYMQILERHSQNNPSECIEIWIPDLLTPIIVVGNGRGALIGAENPDLYKTLVNIDPDNEYKLIVRPITQEDLIK